MCHRCKSAVGGPSTPRHARALSLPRPRAPGDNHLLSTPRPPPHHLHDRHRDHHHLTPLSHYRFRWEGGREREIGGCEIHLSRSSAARTWRCRLVQNPRFCGWRLKPGVQAWVPAYAHGPTRGGMATGQSAHSNASQIAVLLDACRRGAAGLRPSPNWVSAHSTGHRGFQPLLGPPTPNPTPFETPLDRVDSSR